MKNHEMSKEYLPYIAVALEENGISNYEIHRTDAEMGKVCANVSNRLMKKCKRRAWAEKRSRQVHMPVLTREDIPNMRNGIIPEAEFFHFMKAAL